MPWDEKPPGRDRRGDRKNELKHEDKDDHTGRKILRVRTARIERLDLRDELTFEE